MTERVIYRVHDLYKYIKIGIIFFLSIIILSNAISIINEKTESNYDKCLDSCYNIKKIDRMYCYENCNIVLLVQENKLEKMFKFTELIK